VSLCGEFRDKFGLVKVIFGAEDPERNTKEETNKQKVTERERYTDIQRDEWRGKKRNRKI